MVKASDCAMTVPVALAPFIERRPLRVLTTRPAMARFVGGAFHWGATGRYRVVERLLAPVRESIGSGACSPPRRRVPDDGETSRGDAVPNRLVDGV